MNRNCTVTTVVCVNRNGGKGKTVTFMAHLGNIDAHLGYTNAHLGFNDAHSVYNGFKDFYYDLMMPRFRDLDIVMPTRISWVITNLQCLTLVIGNSPM
jgi:hypothetical protein